MCRSRAPTPNPRHPAAPAPDSPPIHPSTSRRDPHDCPHPHHRQHLDAEVRRRGHLPRARRRLDVVLAGHHVDPHRQQAFCEGRPHCPLPVARHGVGEDKGNEPGLSPVGRRRPHPRPPHPPPPPPP